MPSRNNRRARRRQAPLYPPVPAEVEASAPLLAAYMLGREHGREAAAAPVYVSSDRVRHSTQAAAVAALSASADTGLLLVEEGLPVGIATLSATGLGLHTRLG